ncbi:hypothetical protein WJX72_007875 [[Myrmecia] bisecta]|uniref:Uncharacterized protein n=1 Tax=[Myrmecia] bisecta TaxID=41462 RepID=A0AAW1PTL8_9CHLO
MSKQAEPDLVYNGQALKAVKSWLGLSSTDEALEGAAAVDPDWGKPRPAFLGLGAKFLPHHKAAALMAPVEKRLNQKIQAAAAERRLGKLENQATERGGAGGANEGEDAQPEAEESDVDSEGRAGTFGKPKATATAASKPDWLEPAPSGTSKKSKKQKKRKLADGTAAT